MFKVYCRSKVHKQWKPYSQPFIELSNALKCKEKCELRKICDVHGNLIEYKVVEEKWNACFLGFRKAGKRNVYFYNYL